MRAFRRTKKLVAPPLAALSLVMLTGTPAYAQHMKQERERAQRTREAAAAMGLDEEWLVDPAAYRQRVVEGRARQAGALLERMREQRRASRPAILDEAERLRERAALDELHQVVREARSLVGEGEGDGAKPAVKERARALRARLQGVTPTVRAGLGRDASEAEARSRGEGEAARQLEEGILDGATALAAELDDVVARGALEGAAERSLRKLTKDARGRARLERQRTEPERGLERGPREVVPVERAPAQSREDYLKGAWLDGADDGIRLGAGDLFDELTPELEQLLEHIAPGDLSGYRAPLPVRLADASGFAALAELARSALASQLPAPVAADTQATVDAAFAPEVQALAASLDGDPARIYAWVKSEIDFDLYHGSSKGALGALLEKRANDFDQASLLIALLRASGVPARYIYGTVELPAASAMELTGTTTASMAANILLSTGTPARVIYYSGGRVTVEVEHAWVTAYIAYGDYRGIGNERGERVWVELDPSFKAHRVDEGEDLAGKASFDLTTWINGNDRRLPIDAWRDSLRAYVRSSGLVCPTLADAVWTRDIVGVQAGKVPDTLPFAVVARLDNYAVVPGGKRHSVTLSIPDRYYDVDVTVTVSLPQGYGKKLALRWEGSSAAEQAAIDQNGPFGVPSSTRVVPAVYLDEQRLAGGSTWNRGEEFRLDVAMFYPGFGTTTEDHDFDSGAYHVVQLSPGRNPEALIAKADALRGQLERDGAPAWKVDEASLWRVALRYHQGVYDAAAHAFGINGMGFFMDPLEAATSRMVEPTGSFGFTTGIRDGGYNIDASKNTVTPYGRDGDVSALREPSVRLWGYTSSALEHRVWEELGGAEGVSAVRALQIAKLSGQPIYQAKSAFEWQAIRGGLTISSFVKSQIDQYVGAGYEVIVHRDPVALRGWRGTGYVLFHPTTLSGAYLIEGTRGGDYPPANILDLVNYDAGPEPCSGPPDPPAGSTVQPSSGRFVFDQLDLEVPTVAGTAPVRRGYSSRPGISSHLGPGFVSTFDQYLDLAELDEGLITYVDDRGDTKLFALLNNGRYIGPPGSFDFIDPRIGGDGYTLKFSSGSYLRFTESGKLEAIARGKNRLTPLTVVRDAAELPSSVKDPGGKTLLTFTHDAGGRLVTLADAAGRELSYDYDQSGRLVEAVGLDGLTWTFGWDAGGRLAEKTSPEGATTRYFYDAEGRLARVELPDGGQRSLVYDPYNRRTVYTDATGRSSVYQYDEYGTTTRVTDPAGNASEYDYQEGGTCQTVTDARGNESIQEYDENGNVTRQVEPDGTEVSYQRDAQGRMVGQTGSDGTSTEHGYAADGKLESIVARNGATLGLSFDEYRRPTSLTRPGGETVRMAYDENGNAERVTTANGDVFSIERDAAGRTTRMAGGGSVVDVESNDRGLVTKMTSAYGDVELDYDASGRVTEERASTGQVTRYGYDHQGNMTSFSSPTGASWSSTFDAEGRRVAVTDPNGASMRYEYDEGGAVSRVIDREGNVAGTGYCADEATALSVFSPLRAASGTATLAKACVVADGTGSVLTRAFDEAGNIVSVTTSAGTTFRLERDEHGRVTKTIDELGRATLLEYNALGKLAKVTDAAGGVTSYEYDSFGNKTALTDPMGRRRTYQLDSRGKVIKQRWPDGSEEHTQYDAFGIEKAWGPAADSLNTVERSNIFGLSRVRYFDGLGDTVYTLAASGAVQSATTRDVAVGYRYDSLGRAAGHTVRDAAGGPTLGIVVERDAQERISSVKLDGESGALRYYYDQNDRPVRIVAADGRAFTLAYDAAGRIVEVSHPNRVTQHFLYGPRGEVLSTVTQNQAGAVLQAFAYTYDAAGNRVKQVDHLGRTTNYGYDVLNRLVTVSGPNRTETYSYDKAGNRLTATINGQTTSYGYDAGGRLTQAQSPAGVVSYAYDDEGRLEQRSGAGGTTTYTWDARGFLTQVTTPTGAVVKYGYGPEGQRLWREENGERVFTLWHDDAILFEIDEAGAVKRRYIPGPADGLLFAVVDGGAWRYAHTDAMRSVTHFTDDNAQVAASFSYAPYGAAERTSGAIGGPPAMFTGMPYDEAIGAYLTRSRVYDPFIGRFWQRDAHPGEDTRPKTLNPYAYALNNPTLYVDRGGNFSLVDTFFGLLEESGDVGDAANGAARAGLEALLGSLLPGGLALRIIEFLWKLTIFIAFFIGLIYYEHFTQFFFIAAAALEDEGFLIDWAVYTYVFFTTFIVLFTTSAMDMIFDAPDPPEVPDDLRNGRWWCVRGMIFCFVANMIIAEVVGKLPDIIEDIEDELAQMILGFLVELLQVWLKWLLLVMVGCPAMGGGGDD